ncbi:hypothetical protein ACFOOL_06865 [Devosia honganensis]|uniref:N-acetyltransferase domain-containing protein n=1 Tax=Devosia honganensis TaxID=1610527 RepID=A0ABV7WYW5_9HYPH
MAQINERSMGGPSHEIWDGISLASVNPEAIDYARLEWPKFYNEGTHLGFSQSWERLFYRFGAMPDHFGLAIWQQFGDTKVLQGLALGKPSRAKTHLTINWVERSFEPTYFRGGILIPILACAEEYANLLGCQRVLIKDPIDPGVYERYGYTPFTLHKGAEYLAKELPHGCA